MGTQAAQSERRQWDGVLRRSIDITARSIDTETRSIEVVASTDSLDAHGDILEQDWDLKRYKRNPVVLWNHNLFESSPYSMGGSVSPDDVLPIGRAENVRITKNGLEAKLIFSKVNPRAEIIFGMMQEGTLRAVSVGFRPGKVTEELKEGRKVFRLADNELREISVVPIGSNPDAVAKSIAWERENLARMAGAEETAPSGKENAMTAEEKAVYESTLERLKTLETELRSEKAASERLEAELKAASDRAAKAEAGLIETAIEKLVGTKITPAERDEHVLLAKDIGLERVQRILAARPDLKLLDPVTVDGKSVAHTEQPAAPSSETSDGSAEIVKAANAAIRAA